MGKVLKGVGIAAAIAGLAAFFLGTKKGQKMTKQAMDRTEDIVDDITARIRALGETTEERYEEVVARAAQEWKDMKNATNEEVELAKKRVQERWEQFKRERNALKGNSGHHCDKC